MALLPANSKEAFETETPSARQVADFYGQLTEKVSRELTNAQEALKAAKLRTDHAKETERARLEKAQAPAEEKLADLHRFDERLKALIPASAEERLLLRNELLLLGRVQEKLRDRAANPDEVASKLVAADGDELDVTVTLKPLTDYKLPPAATAASPFTYTRTLPVTQRFRVSVSAGIFVSPLINHRFSLFEDSTLVGRRPKPGAGSTDTATVLNYRRMKRIERENTLDNWDVGITTLTHFHYRLFPAIDVAASVGVGVQTNGIRAMGGGTLLFGGKTQRFCLTYGVVIGPVTRLSGGYAEGGKVPVSLNTVPTQSVNQKSWFVAASWNLTGDRK
jgi:hypothetical protein